MNPGEAALVAGDDLLMTGEAAWVAGNLGHCYDEKWFQYGGAGN